MLIEYLLIANQGYLYRSNECLYLAHDPVGLNYRINVNCIMPHFDVHAHTTVFNASSRVLCNTVFMSHF